MKKLLFMLASFAALVTFAQDTTGTADKKKAALWLFIATTAANDGDINAFRQLGAFYAAPTLFAITGTNTINTWQEPSTAISWFKRARRAGCMECYWQMAWVVLKYDMAPDIVSYDTLANWLENTTPATGSALNILGQLYEQNIHNYPKAEVAYTRAIQLGSKDAKDRLELMQSSRPDAWQLAQAALQGGDMTTFLERAQSVAVFQNNSHAAYMVGYTYLNGVAGRRDADKAQQWFVRAGDLGYGDGYFYAAKYYYDQWRVETNRKAAEQLYTKANDYWKKAASNGSVYAGKWNLKMEEENKQRLAASKPVFNGRYGFKYEYQPSASTNTNKSDKSVVCRVCHGTGMVENSPLPSLDQDKSGNWYHVYKPKTSACGYCNGTGRL
jgi:TPR repeat protein